MTNKRYPKHYTKNDNLLNYQPSSEHNSQPIKMVLGTLSLDLPVQNPDANHPPNNHGGSSSEDDSGFQID